MPEQDVDARDKRGHDEGEWSAHCSQGTLPLSRDASNARVLSNITLEETEGAGNAGRLAAPAALCAKSESTQA